MKLINFSTTNNHLKLVKKLFLSSNLNFSSKSNKNKHFYITTPIFYVNSKPHLGHLYTLLVADAYFRFEKLLNNFQSYTFATGTDEHGIKIQEAAQAAGLDCKKFCDINSSLFKSLCENFSISNTNFIRTTDDRHKKVVEKVWDHLLEKEYIYKSDYSGWYSTNEETFISSLQVCEVNTFIKKLEYLIESSIENEIQNPKKVLSFIKKQLQEKKNHVNLSVDVETGNLLEYSKEFNYMFKLSSFKQQLLDLVHSEDSFLANTHRKNILINMINEMNDISISRSKNRLNWGITVPNDETQIIYVWFDALCSYLTAANYDDNSKFIWPPNIQIIGKDIIKFHGIFLPAFLLALNLDLPGKLHSHAHWQVDNIKMSKSKGNVIDPNDYLETYKVDGLRHFILKFGVPHNDGNFNSDKLKETVNSDLANTLGNLVQRSMNTKININQKYFKPNLSNYLKKNDFLKNYVEELSVLSEKVHDHYKKGHFYLGLELIYKTLHSCNKLFNDGKPWDLVKKNKDDEYLVILLYLTYETLRITSILLSPITPYLSETILDKLNIKLEERLWVNCKLILEPQEDRQLNSSNKIFYEKIKI